MKKSTVAIVACALIAVVAIGVRWQWFGGESTSAGTVPRVNKDAVAAKKNPAVKTRPQSAGPPPPAAPRLSAEEKAARIAKIKRDYDEIRMKASADYSAAGAKFPGGLNAFLRQLALLEREKRADFAKILTPRELEDLEFVETTAGQLVQRLLGATSADEQLRRAVFKFQLEFDDRFALTFDTSPAGLLERETARQVLQGGIAGLLGNDDLFAAWDQDFARWRTFATEQGLAGRAAWELWNARNEFTRKRLELAAQKLSPEQLRSAQALLTQQTETRVMSIVGPAVWQSAARNDALSWVPKK
jgi:hypothetical protein